MLSSRNIQGRIDATSVWAPAFAGETVSQDTGEKKRREY
jgi:hypothetical protein